MENKIYRLTENLNFSDVGSSVMIIDKNCEKAYLIKNSGLEIIKLINGKRTIYEIAVILSHKFNKTSFDTILNDVIEFLSKLSSLGFCDTI